MDKLKKPAAVGPLFAEDVVLKSEPERIWDDNNEDPANEERWLNYFKTNRAAMSASESEFVSEYERRRNRV